MTGHQITAPDHTPFHALVSPALAVTVRAHAAGHGESSNRTSCYGPARKLAR